MPGRMTRLALFPAILFCFATGQTLAWQEPRTPQSLAELDDTNLLAASENWRKMAAESRRKIADVVCLVPNRETFLEALGAWDDKTFFPILIDDPELNLKFISAFRPKRVVRYPGKVDPVPNEKIWPVALTAALRGILPAAEKPRGLIPGNILWLQQPPRSPGMVLARQGDDAIAAAALAAGRKQGLALWPEDKNWGDVLSVDDAALRARAAEVIMADIKAKADKMGDDIDFITLMGDLPYRYNTPQGINCLDDLIGRNIQDEKAQRWAYAGRIRGSLRQQIYMVMCGLFLQPSNALLFNGYGPTDPKSKGYPLATATSRLDSFGFRSELARDGTLAAWRKSFFPTNEAGLIFVNSSGEPTAFNLQGSTGTTWDVPWSVPTRIHIIHSFSAADAADPYTIAGRWLANGAYGYFGSVNEPYLQSFRSAGLITDCLMRGLPWAASVRQNPGREMFGQPWRLMVFGDPLMIIEPPRLREARVDSMTTANWPEFKPEPVPDENADPMARLAWAVRQSLVQASGSSSKESASIRDIAKLAAKIPRDKLPGHFRPVRDELVACLSLESRQLADALKLAREVPRSEASPALLRMMESAAAATFQQAMAKSDLEEALPAWRVLASLCPRTDLRDVLAWPVATLATTPVRKRLWIRTLESIETDTESSEDLKKWAKQLSLEADKIK
ncbi:MAG: hypothetical protein ACKO85_13075 [Isosphaeraceae bacterium]